MWLSTFPLVWTMEANSVLIHAPQYVPIRYENTTTTTIPKPCSFTPKKLCGLEAEITASAAIFKSPVVPFYNRYIDVNHSSRTHKENADSPTLKPTGIDSPEASSRCNCLMDILNHMGVYISIDSLTYDSVVRAPRMIHDTKVSQDSTTYVIIQCLTDSSPGN